MCKHFLKIISLMMFFVMSIATTAFADVPDPSGYNRRRPMPPAFNQYYIQKESRNSSYSEKKVAIVLKYNAPLDAQIDYLVKDDSGNILTQGTERSGANGGTLLVLLDKPAADQTYNAHLQTSCYVFTVLTSFGPKKVDDPVLAGTWNCDYTVTGIENGRVLVNRTQNP